MLCLGNRGRVFAWGIAGVLWLVCGQNRSSAGKVHPVPVSPAESSQPEFCAGCHDNARGAVVHPALSMGCDTCHQFTSKGDDTQVSFVAEGTALCLQCHADKGPAQRKNQHPPVVDSCTTCHNPHSTSLPRLLKAQQSELCLTCHEKAKGETQHGPYAAGNCTQCHDPHGADRPRFLRAETNALCEGCHKPADAGARPDDTAKTVALLWDITIPAQEYADAPKIGLDRSGSAGHPVVGHPISGKNKHAQDPPITCLSCHQPHASALPKLMPEGLQRDFDLCERCHQ